MPETALLNMTLSGVLAVFLTLLRVGPLVFFMPVIGSRGVPVQVKALTALVIAVVLAPVVPLSLARLPTTALGVGLLVTREILFAGILALFVRLVFAAVQLAGQYVSISMGMGMAAAMDPQFGSQTSLIGIFWNLVAILIFLAVDGHHIFLSTLVESYRWVEPGGLRLTEASFRGMMAGVSHMFVLAIKVMAPAGAALLFSHVAMGVLAKIVPQIPVMIVAMPLNIALGFVFVGLSLSFFLPLMVRQFDMLGRLLPRLVMGLGG
ncbi:MAG TPA: flagellar biosynthetic protein FliR [Desulfobacterales bacterium]|nr:flagellar biosynthetic protein FliR [Desulfobacterales bacterium]